ILRGVRQQQDEPGRFSICSRQAAVVHIGFNDDGTQVLPVPARIGGRAEGLNALLKSCGWEAVSNDDHWKLVTISAG
ncbi:hypothetical protein JNS16_28115, partial [Klebsiella pneumoniae]|nr:hypothetical protein [Klebsiella pneumoniae]